jgi:hypothetical protein
LPKVPRQPTATKTKLETLYTAAYWLLLKSLCTMNNILQKHVIKNKLQLKPQMQKKSTPPHSVPKHFDSAILINYKEIATRRTAHVLILTSLVAYGSWHKV